MKKEYLVPITGVLLLAAVATAAILYDTQKVKELSETVNKNASSLVRDYSPKRGNQNAKVTIVEFFDPACETCRAFHPLVEKLMASRPGKINLVLRYVTFHKGSDYVVKILESARLQNKFWETLEAALEAQPYWASHGNPQPEKLWRYLGGFGLDLNKIREDMHSSTIADRIKQDMADAQQLRVTKTPGFFVNGNPLVQFGYEQLQNLVETEIRKHY
jgi:protein-disulfide isomerase